MSKAKLKPIYWLRNYLSENYQRKTDKFLGQVLTIIDAAISDKEQRKGIKDLIQASVDLGSEEVEVTHTIDGKDVENPGQEALTTGQCVVSGY